ncbi:MAG: glycerophosphodiester phosphodiesterase [Anaerolineaceae bacterium]|nr:glycerophosphodiester phosphodiesterase [Anaerolineaceae bacterium]
MKLFEIIAHRGLTTHAPENTIEAFQLALDHRADGVEMDVRLSADGIPVVYHYTYLTGFTDTQGVIFDFTLDEIRKVRIPCKQDPQVPLGQISTLREVLELFAGKMALEIEIKGPEPEAPQIIGEILLEYQQHWPMMEITSFEPTLLLTIQKAYPGITCDLLFPRSEAWMGLDVVQYLAAQRARLANARAVHLHPSQLNEEVVACVRQHGIEIHAWDVNTIDDLKLCKRLGIPRICTDKYEQARAFLE